MRWPTTWCSSPRPRSTAVACTWPTSKACVVPWQGSRRARDTCCPTDSGYRGSDAIATGHRRGCRGRVHRRRQRVGEGQPRPVDGRHGSPNTPGTVSPNTRATAPLLTPRRWPSWGPAISIGIRSSTSVDWAWVPTQTRIGFQAPMPMACTGTEPAGRPGSMASLGEGRWPQRGKTPTRRTAD